MQEFIATNYSYLKQHSMDLKSHAGCAHAGLVNDMTIWLLQLILALVLILALHPTLGLYFKRSQCLRRWRAHFLSGMCSPLSRDHARSKVSSAKGCARASPTWKLQELPRPTCADSSLARCA